MHYGDNPRIQTVDNKPCFACGPDHSFFLEHSQLVWFFFYSATFKLVFRFLTVQFSERETKCGNGNGRLSDRLN